ncbi:hypothetical protein PV327_011442, partial [Microctonus hyperodae]
MVLEYSGIWDAPPLDPEQLKNRTQYKNRRIGLNRNVRSNAQIMRHFTTKVAIESFFGRAINSYAQPTTSGSSKPHSSIQPKGKRLLVYAIFVFKVNSKNVASPGKYVR